MSSKDPCSLGEAEVLRRTDRAILVKIETGDERWVPLSVIHDDSEIYEGSDNDGELVVEEWWAEKEGLS